MSCFNCTSTPALPVGLKDIYINASHDFILDRIEDRLGQSCGIEIKNGFLMARAEIPEFLDLLLVEEFSDMEKQNIMMLVKDCGAHVDFHDFQHVRTLESWSILYRSIPLIEMLGNGAFSTFFQPIVQVTDMSIFGYECLSRGVLKDGSYMNPGGMFEIAKKTGMLFNLDRQCRETAIKTAAVKNIKKNVFINFLPTAIYNPEFCLRDTVKWATQLEFDPAKLTFEVVETEKIDSVSHLKSIFDYYHQRGFQCALDDVGSGYSSLNILAALSPDILKIDMELIRGIHKTPTKQSIVSALVSLAKNLNCKIIAEGIETVDEFEWIQQTGIDFVQGYYFAKPRSEPITQLP